MNHPNILTIHEIGQTESGHFIVTEVGGIHDPIFSPDALRGGVAAPFANVRLALLDSNHEVPIEQPREFAALIQAFLAGLGD